MFHTQEYRMNRLSSPVLCDDELAWLGDAYYFWCDIEDAEYWGTTHKRRTGYYQIYQADIDLEKVLDTVFNEEHYRFWLSQVEKAAKKIGIATGEKPTLKEINAYFKERGSWDNVDGVLFQDLPQNQDRLMVKSFYYRKRIQVAVYNLPIVSNFSFLTQERCLSL